MDNPLDAGVLRRRLQARVARRLVPLFWALSFAFLFFGFVTVVFHPPGATLLLEVVDFGGAIILGIAALLLRQVNPRYANGLAAGALLITLAASLVAIKALHLPAETTNVLLVELVGSVILLSPAWTAVVVIASLAGWSLVAASEGLGPLWLNAGFALVASSIMAVMIQFVRIRDAHVTEELSEANREKQLALDEAYAEERAKARELAAANDSLEAFTYVIAHDLKEPLRAMHTYLGEAREAASTDERTQMLDQAIRSEAQLERLVTGLLDLSRMTQTPLEPQAVDVAELLNDAATRAMFERVIQERRARLLVDQDFPKVQATVPILRQLLGNLILNAAKYNTRGDAQVRVYRAPDGPRGKVDIVVEDNGPGFPPDVLRSVGESGAPRNVKGGFGLLIATRAAGRLGGTIHVQNRPEGGAAVHVLLPSGASVELERRVRELV
ncbi:MAG: sensor histidine kinase [Thermoplasmatota archaeon]